MKSLKVNSLVDLISKNDPESYGKILNKYPASSEYLQPGLILGEVSVEVKAVAELTIGALSQVMNSSRKITGKLQKKIDRHRAVRLTGNIVAALTGAGLISAILIGETEVAIITAIVNFISILSVLISDFIESSLYGEKKDINQYIQYLIKSVVDADRYKAEIELLLAKDSSEGEIITLVKKANLVAAELRAAEMYVGLAHN